MKIVESQENGRRKGTMGIIQTEHLVYEYAKRDEEGNITGRPGPSME